jgi:hypothetical protein
MKPAGRRTGPGLCRCIPVHWLPIGAERASPADRFIPWCGGERYMQAKPIGRCQAEALEQLATSVLERADPGWTDKAHPLMPVILHQTVRSLADAACAASSGIPPGKRRALLRVAARHGVKLKSLAPAFDQRRSTACSSWGPMPPWNLQTRSRFRAYGRVAGVTRN